MSVHHPQEIKEYLQRQDVQERIQLSIQQARSNVTVTISKAADLFSFTEGRLREWEKRGILTTDRVTSDGKEGHRRYTANELDKLAILQELIEKGGYSLSQIPADLNAIWKDIESAQQNNLSMQSDLAMLTDAKPHLASKKPINQRVKFAEQEVFWRYFVSQVLRLSLMLICEDIPETLAGLILPFGAGARFISEPKDLSTLREVLVGWQDQNGSFDTFLDSAPFFEHPSDFRIESLVAVGEENKSLDPTMIIVQREATALNLSLPLVQTIRRLMAQIYDNVSQWKSAFNDGKRDYLYQATDFSNNAHPSDKVLDTLMNMVIQLGGKFAAKPEQNRWKFCCLLLPQDNALPVQQRSLTVQAQSINSPYKLGTSVESTKDPLGLSLRAYQSGNIIYEPDIVVWEALVAPSEQEKEQSTPTRSAIALPIIREDGLSIAVLYLASDKAHAFPVENQRVLRLIGTMIEELLLTYHARQQAWGKRTYLIDKPEIVDPAFQDFFTENDFICDLEKLLATMQAKDASKYSAEEEVSFIAIDIDNQSTFATHYGDRVARNLSLEVGTRLQEHLKLFAKLNNKPLYHLNADRYFLLLDGMSLDDARKNAEQIRIALKDNYQVDAQHFTRKGTKLPSNMLKIPELTVRLGVTSYTNQKLKEVLRRYSSEIAIAKVRELIMDSLDATLSTARRGGGNIIISWDPTIWGYAPWSPSLLEQSSG